MCRIAGWNRRAYPMLQASFHIGDQLISINDKPVTSAKAAVKMLKSCADRITARLVLRRLPAGYVCLLRRDDNHFESLGLQIVGGTAEVSLCILVYVIITKVKVKSTIPIVSPEFPHVPLRLGGWHSVYEERRLFVHAISFEDFQPMWS